MRGDRFIRTLLLTVVSVAVLPAAAYAQSQIGGQVVDNTGGVLPGVTIEASSPVLIEGSRVAVTDGQGRYGIVDLRPGTYEVTFVLPGFSTVIRDGLVLPADFAMTIDVEMRVGTLEETITVSGESPIVDVQQAQRTQVMSRETYDALPTGRSWQTRVALMTGVTSSLDIGGSNSTGQHNITSGGMDADDTTVIVDGMNINSNSSGGSSQYYFNDAFASELSFQTSGIDAETSGGGLRVNMIPREGGNAFSGSFHTEFMNRDFVTSNLSSALVAEGVTSVDSLDKVMEFNAALGGPILRDKLWFFWTAHRRYKDTVVLGSVYPNGDPGINDLELLGNNVRLTYQVSSQNKFAIFMDRNNKISRHAHDSKTDIATASTTRGVGKYGPRFAAAAKLTSAVSSRVLFEVGWTTNRVDYNNLAQEDRRFPRPLNVRTCHATPCLDDDPNQYGADVNAWYVQTPFRDKKLVGNNQNSRNPRSVFNKRTQRHVISGKVSYVTGSHNIKAGVQHDFGPETRTYTLVGDMRSQEYSAGVPKIVEVSNFPALFGNNVKSDLGIYAQDSWTLDRLTVSPGVRFEWFKAENQPGTSPAGRWVPARDFDAILDRPDWFDVSPRVGLAYDLFGTAETALKFHVGMYSENTSFKFTDRYNPLERNYEKRDWFDCYMDGDPDSGSVATACLGGNPYGTNGDDIVQDWEVGTGTPGFAASPKVVNTFDPNTLRPRHLRTALSIDHQLLPWLGVTTGWYHTKSTRLFVTNDQIKTLADYAAFSVTNPHVAGQSISIYNLDSTKKAKDRIDTNATTDRSIYDGIEFSFNARIPGGGTAFGGLMMERHMNVFCNSPFDPNSFRFCDETGGSGETDALKGVTGGLAGSGFSAGKPFRSSFKMAGDYPLPGDILLAAVYRSLPGVERFVIWDIPSSEFPSSRTQSLDIRLNAPGSEYEDRINVFDLSLAKFINLPQGARVRVGVDIYNIFNPDTVLQRDLDFEVGGSFNDVDQVILGRFWRVLAQLTF